MAIVKIVLAAGLFILVGCTSRPADDVLDSVQTSVGIAVGVSSF